MAPRSLWRGLRGLARGAVLASGTWLAGAAAAETITDATYGGETTRYAHGVLGDAVEYTTLEITVEDGSHTTRYRVTLPDDHVFEDVAPRLWDVTGDGKPEVVVIETDMALGGSLAVYDQSGKIAETDHIGRTNRWLAPVGAADFDGDGRIEVAFVDRPHLAKTLRIFEFSDGVLALEAEIVGLTNHRIGEDFITGGLRACGDGLQLITANADWSRVMVTDWFDGRWRVTPDRPFSPGAIEDVLACR